MAAEPVQMPVICDASTLAGYIQEQIVALHGPQLPCPGSASIINGFWERFGEKGFLIARRAFTAHRGVWMGAPITVARFGESNDEYFALPLLKELEPGGDL